MRRKDREVTNTQEILDILKRCDTLRLGLMNGDSPYVVPVSFGLDLSGKAPVIYFHSAKQGQKVDCINGSGDVAFEADIFYKVEPWKMGITARYESVMGSGEITEVTDEDEKVHGLKTMLEHYSQDDYPVARCRGLAHANVYRIDIEQITGKKNLPEQK